MSVFVEAQGEPSQVRAFFDAICADLPPLATITSRRETELATIGGEQEFRIVASRRSAGAITLIPADTATCPDCVADIADPTNRRYRYPFTTCTNCGPRLSIICDVPYDRPLTTMAEFAMCPSCQREYSDPSDRRYHAQPISCFDCGPDLWLEYPNPDLSPEADESPTRYQDSRARFENVIAEATGLLHAGKILAVKGIGGFTLICDARNPQAVETLRARKRRLGKPLAVMAGSVAAARSIADLSKAQLQALTSPAAPIVLAPMAKTYDLADQVAPGLDDVGVMAPYTPLHRLLLAVHDIVVATSANSSSLPLTYRNDEARALLSNVVDAFLMHDRGIHVPVEDSVVIAADKKTLPIRRSRGFAPLPVQLGGSDRCVLAVGAELKNTFALTRDQLAFMSAHIGDMGSLETQTAFEKSVAQMMTAHRRTPELVVTDMHPGYATRAWGQRYAERIGIPVLEIQHHHAHALSLLAESRELTTPMTCIVLDGTGYGTDKTIWGGEILRLGENPLEFERCWHLPGFWLPGGDSAIRSVWKSAAGLAWEHDIDVSQLPAFKHSRNDAEPGAAGSDEWDLVQSQLENQVGVTRTTSTGRLFDGVASLLGVCQRATYEAQAAMELEAVARRCSHDHHLEISTLPELMTLLISGIYDGRPTACLARSFHNGLAQVLTAALLNVQESPAVIGLTGGVFANRLLSIQLQQSLANAGYLVRQHQIVPANDGGLALGQAFAGVLRR